MTQPEFLRRILDAKGIETAFREAFAKSAVMFHAYEEQDMFRPFPEDLWKGLEANEALFATAKPKIDDVDKVAIVSGSVPPPMESGHSVTPYTLGGDGHVPTVGYMIMIGDDGTDTPARLLRTFIDQRATGFDNTSKELFLGDLPHAASMTKQEYIQAAFDNPDAHKAEMKTITEGQFRDYPVKVTQMVGGDPNAPIGPISMPWNEAMAVMGEKHLMSIAVPRTSEMNEFDGFRLEESKLWGALAGLAHLRHPKHPMDLPVIQYHVDSPNMGGVTVLARGEDQLLELANAAMYKLKTNKHFLEDDGSMRLSAFVHQQARAILGKDLMLPLDQLGLKKPGGHFQG